MMQLLGLPTLLHQPGVRANLEVRLLYTQIDAMGPLFVTIELGDRPLGFLKPTFYLFKISLITNWERRILP